MMTSTSRIMLAIILSGLFLIRFFYADALTADMLDFISGILAGSTVTVALVLLKK